MPLTHAKVSAKADTADASLVQPSDWNANHVIDIFVDNETPTGTVNGENAVFNLSTSPSPAASLRLYVDGVLQYQNVNYTLLGAVVTFEHFSIPQTGEALRAFYRKA